MSSQLNHKLHQFEEVPPSGNWEAIAHALDEGEYQLGKKLYHYESTAPQAIWTNIENVLGSNTVPGNIKPFYTRYRQVLKYVAAAALLVLVASLITLFLNKDNDASTDLARQAPLEEPSGGATPGGQTSIAIDQVESNVSTLQENKTNATPDNNRSAARASVGKTNRYLTMDNEEGDKVRLSRKAYTVFNCAENNNSINYKRCKENIELMQQKMSASLLSPSGDFGGLIDILKSLEEKE
ncbi:MAG: hypothetical protein WKF70_09410 [Chitinophagaceae bacterium]